MERQNKNEIDVIIETPRGCRNKYAYDKKQKAFRLRKILPAGHVFPFDFGFIPETKGGDGDPLDVLVMMDEPAYPGCVIECRMLGVLKAKQTEAEGTQENHRLIAVSLASLLYSEYKDIKDVQDKLLHEIEHFFISYNELDGKKFLPQGCGNAAEALALIEKAG